MPAKFKIILATAVCTTFGWVVVIAVVFYLWAGTGGPIAIMQFPHPGDPTSVEWQPQKGEFTVQLISSNVATSATSILFSRTSRPPERIWFQTVITEPRK